MFSILFYLSFPHLLLLYLKHFTDIYSILSFLLVLILYFMVLQFLFVDKETV